jgi:hypothetical protein
MVKTKYCLFSGHESLPKAVHPKVPENNEQAKMPIIMSGLFAWHAAFKRFGGEGDLSANLTREFMEHYDAIHVNYTPGNASYVAAIRDTLGKSDTKIVMNIDHAIDMFSTMDYFILEKMSSSADFIFHVEELATNRLERCLGRKVWCIPHPCDVWTISKFYKQIVPQNHVISCQHHRYLNSWEYGFYATKKIRKEFEVSTVLMNYWLDGRPPVPIDAYFDDILERMDYPDYIQALARSYINMDMTPMHTYGRGVIDAAALGIPTIGSNTISAARKLFPSLTCDSMDDAKMESLLRGLLMDVEFTQSCVDNALDTVKYYDYTHSVERWNVMMESKPTKEMN